MTDEYVIQYCNQNKRRQWKNRDKNVINYLLNRFNDFSVDNIYDKCRESLFRLKHNINELPKCDNCGKSLKFLIKFKFYPSACCNECMNILKVNKFHKTSLIRYGTYTPAQSNNIKEKQKNTNIKKYGGSSPLCDKKIKNKAIETLLEKYNVDNIAKSNQWKTNVNNTSLKKYGTLYPNQSNIVKNKIKQSLINHYGVDNYFKTDECKIKANSKEAKYKGINTKKKNHTLNKSKIEIDSYKLLKEKYPDVIYQYKSIVYPFMCDFYIPSLDLYIECNYHWTHGCHPYLGTQDDLKLIEYWKSKNTQYYNNAINCWSIRDVHKRNIAKQNNLNYKEFFTILDLQNWLNKNDEKNN